MTFADIANGTAVFVDANTFVYAFAPDPQFGPSCEQLLERIERQHLQGFTSSHVLSDVAHRLMTLEACAVFGWPFTGITARLQRHPTEVRQLSRFRQAITAVLAMGIEVLPVYDRHVISAAALSQQMGLLSNDALVVSIMQEQTLTQLASHDADFDTVVGIQRFGP
ncbi:MAG: type II toxin-antitoxin system VapC family toxin [Planctomycetaceae bacterium]